MLTLITLVSISYTERRLMRPSTGRNRCVALRKAVRPSAHVTINRLDKGGCPIL